MRYLRVCLLLCATLTFSTMFGSAMGKKVKPSNKMAFELQEVKRSASKFQKDSLRKDSLSKNKKNVYVRLSGVTEKEINNLSLFPAISLQQGLQGNYAGLYIQEPSGEPGSIQNMFLRGAPMPLLSKKDVFESQPLVVLDGIPLVGEHPFAFDIQQYDFNRIGPATNLLTNIDLNNIISIQVLKDLASTSEYGPRGANGVILLTSRSPSNSRSITFNSYIGMAQRPTVTTINGKYENEFRQRFYKIYTTNGRFSDDEEYPVYLSDSLSTVYSGKSDWTDLYYRNALVYGINVGISGGTDRASFRASLGNTKNNGVADGTGLDRYSAMFNINMKPLNWLHFTAMINANRLNRNRNRTLRDRFAQLNYFPDMSAPLAPSKDFYGTYITQYNKGFDDNKTNTIEGYARLTGTFGKLKLTSSFNVDYNEGYRDVFYARTLLQGNSYASNYYGFNQRLMINNKASYDFYINKDHSIYAEAGQSVMYDIYKYNNNYAYKGANDYIKINLLNNDLTSLSFPRELTYRFLDKTRENLVSFYAKGNYSYQDKYFFSATLRTDGSSNAQPTKRWFYSPVLAAAWDLKKDFGSDLNVVDDLILRASIGRIGRTNSYDNYAQGPQYTASVGYTGNPTVPGYNAFGVLTRSYSFGWVGYGIPWAYSNQLNVGTDVSLFKRRLNLAFDVYSKTEKNLLLGIPSYAEYGYKQSIESGMSVNNTGIDLTATVQAINKNQFSWTSSININYNENKLKSLPRGLDEIVIGNRYLKVGQPIDQYWLLTNNGIYTSSAEVPVVAGQPLKFNGIALKAGDPKWQDINGDNIIDDKDKQLKGHSLPKFFGGFDNNFKYGKWTLNTNLYFNLGRQLVNQEMANRFNFVNREGNTDLSSVKEITYWEKRGDYTKYPLYNPWSSVIPYRVEQDLFLENASFLKLRSVSIGYDLTSLLKKKNINVARFYAYGSANNLFVLTKYSGQDPELVNYDGMDTGYALPIPKIYTIGIKMEL